ncbi:hypothetical protein [Burkholderia multivorans]|uniref:hypothetical protein n=1 Tax=Burkholderia multivorans TaxID=87883 RepID=UPI001C23558D|nr:hypothetical protein [Burkholderia multivorans]MBU9477042.1 hypothetical protein [Burkholderia multivorans]
MIDGVLLGDASASSVDDDGQLPLVVYLPSGLRMDSRRSLPEVDVFAIHAIEDNPPQGVEPLEWMPLSSVPATSLEEILERLVWYARRWAIEGWHQVLADSTRRCNPLEAA